MRLQKHVNCDPELILVGEAPGYQGCHFTGVPFTSERLIENGRIPRLEPYRITKRATSYTEPTATIVWDLLHDLHVADRTVCWNAFPYHPIRFDDNLSIEESYRTNRAPSPSELLIGQKALHIFLGGFSPSARIVAVGRKAEKTLKQMPGIRFRAIRHPSQGGASEFRRQLHRITAS